MTTTLTDRVYAEGFFDWPPEPHCLGCGHYRPIHCHFRPDTDRGLVCHYLLDRGRARGCAFGRGCTRWEV